MAAISNTNCIETQVGTLQVHFNAQTKIQKVTLKDSEYKFSEIWINHQPQSIKGFNKWLYSKSLHA